MPRRLEELRFRYCDVFAKLTGFGLLFVLALGAAQISATAAEPSAAPAVFTTENYGLTVDIPRGLFRCSYPAPWVGSDHGIDIYLAKPKACDPHSPSASDAEANDLPRVQIFYGHNVVEISTRGQEPHVPTTNAELMAAHCTPPSNPPPPDLTLMGAPAIGCSVRQGSRISLTIGSLYSQGRGAVGQAPDSLVLVSLDTSDDRYERDIQSLRTVAASIRACEPADRRGQADRQKCPPMTAW